MLKKVRYKGKTDGEEQGYIPFEDNVLRNSISTDKVTVQMTKQSKLQCLSDLGGDGTIQFTPFYMYNALRAPRDALRSGIGRHGVDLDTILLLEPLASPLLESRGVNGCRGQRKHSLHTGDSFQFYSPNPRPSPSSAIVSSMGLLLFSRSFSFLSYSSTSGSFL